MEFHYIITLACPVDGGYATATLDGIITAWEGQTRRDLFGLIYQYAVDQTHLNEPNITFFELAPNELPAVVSSASC